MNIHVQSTFNFESFFLFFAFKTHILYLQVYIEWLQAKFRNPFVDLRSPPYLQGFQCAALISLRVPESSNFLSIEKKILRDMLNDIHIYIYLFEMVGWKKLLCVCSRGDLGTRDLYSLPLEVGGGFVCWYVTGDGRVGLSQG